jgi:hypothetical protein
MCYLVWFIVLGIEVGVEVEPARMTRSDGVKVEDALFSSSSNSIRTDGVKSSSNWPLFTLHKKAVRKPPATRMLIPINTNNALNRK